MKSYTQRLAEMSSTTSDVLELMNEVEIPEDIDMKAYNALGGNELDEED